MATLAEMPTLLGTSSLRINIESSIWIKAYDILTAEVTDTEARRAWATAALANSSAQVDWILRWSIADKQGVAVSTLLSLVDSGWKLLVSNAVDSLYPPAPA